MKQIIPICLLILIIAISYMIYKKREQFTTTTLPPDIYYNSLNELVQNIKNLSDCMLENGTGWGGGGYGKLVYKKLLEKITKIKNAKGDLICDNHRTQIGHSYDKLFNLIQQNYTNKEIEYHPLLDIYLLYWLQQEGYIKFTLINKKNYNTFFELDKTGLYQYANIIKQNLKESIIPELLRFKKYIIQYLNTKNNTTASGQDQELEENVKKIYLLWNNIPQLVLYTMIIYDILSDPLDKCKCIDLG